MEAAFSRGGAEHSELVEQLVKTEVAGAEAPAAVQRLRCFRGELADLAYSLEHSARSMPPTR